MWSLESGEVVTAEAILENTGDAEVYFPLHNVGVDLPVAKNKKHVAVQVKDRSKIRNVTFVDVPCEIL